MPRHTPVEHRGSAGSLRPASRTGTLTLALTLLLPLLLLTACSARNDTASPPTATPTTAATPATTPPPIAQETPPDGVQPLPTQAPVDAWNDALLIGTLVLDNGCIYIESSADTPSRWAVIWQHGWTRQERNGIVELVDPSGTTRAQVGDTVGVGGSGGTHSAAPDPDHPCLQQPDLWFASPDVNLQDVPTP